MTRSRRASGSDAPRSNIDRQSQADDDIVGISGNSARLDHVLNIGAQIEPAGHLYVVEKLRDIFGALNAYRSGVQGILLCLDIRDAAVHVGAADRKSHLIRGAQIEGSFV